MWLLYCIFGIYFCFSTSADNQVRPVISYYITQKTKLNGGQSVELECSVKDVQPGELSWERYSFKNKHSLTISTGTTVLANDMDHHYYLSFNEDNSTYTLKIRHLKVEDAGIYNCVITKPDYRITVDTMLQVIEENSTSEWTPAITYITQNMIKNVGESVELICNVKDAQQRELSWVRNYLKYEPSFLISAGTTVLTNNMDHYYVTYNEDNSTYTLKIRDLQEEDGGIYNCVINKPDTRIKVETNLQVIKPPVIEENSSSEWSPAITYITQNMIKNVGESAEIMCSVKDAQQGELSWVRNYLTYKNSFLISIGTIVLANDMDHYYVTYNEDNSTYTLKIRDLQEEDAGIYKCKITMRDLSVQAETDLQVIKPPVTSENTSKKFEPGITYITRHLLKNVGESIELKCIVPFAQPGKLSWVRENFEGEHSVLISRGNMVLADDIHHYNVRYKAANSVYTLKIRVLQAEDAGIYKCKKIKPGYSISAETKLQVIKRPVILENSTSQSGPVITYISQGMIKKVGETVELECSIENANPDELSWVKIFPEHNYYRYTLTFGTLVFANNEDHYSVKYNAVNSSITLKIRDLKEKDAGIYKCVIVKSNFNVEAGIKLQVTKRPVTSENSSNPSGPVITYITRNIKKTVGESAELVCGVQNAQPDQLAWVKVSADKKFRTILTYGIYVFANNADHYNIRYNAASSTYTITIRDLQEEDAGVYVCQMARPDVKSEAGTILEVTKRPVIAENSSSTGSDSVMRLG